MANIRCPTQTRFEFFFFNFKGLGSRIYLFKNLRSSRLTQASRTSEPEAIWAGLCISLLLLLMYQPHSLLWQIIFHVEGNGKKEQDVATDNFRLTASEERERVSLCPYIKSHRVTRIGPSLGYMCHAGKVTVARRKKYCDWPGQGLTAPLNHTEWGKDSCPNEMGHALMRSGGLGQ